MSTNKAARIVHTITGKMPNRDRIYEPPKLPQCKYPESIKIEILSSLKRTDWFSGLKYYTGQTPLEYLPENPEKIEDTVITFASSLDGSVELSITQPHIKNLQQGIDNFSDFSYYFLRQNSNLHCKKGFTDLMILEFTRLNNPSRFSDYAKIIRADIDLLCVPYEETKTCPALPLDPDDFVQKVGLLVYDMKQHFETSYLGNILSS